MKLNFIHRVFFFAALFGTAVLLFSAEEDIPNLSVIENQLQSRLDSTLQSALRQGDEIKIVFDHVSNEKKAFLKTFFTDYFAEKKVKVRIDSAAVKVIIEQFDVKIVYKETSAKVWGVSSELNRQIVVNLRGVVEDRKSDVIRALHVDKTYMDKISTENVKDIEKSPYSFTTGRLLKKSSWTNLVEPVVVSVSAAVIILLFFVLRT